MADYEATAGLDGTSDAAGTWTAVVGDVLTCNGNVWAGAMIDIPVTLATGRTDLALSPPTFTSLVFTVTVDQLYPAVSPYFYTLYLVNDPTPEDYATGVNSPTSHVDNGNTLTMVEERVIVGPLTAGQEISTTLDLDLVFPLYRQSAWVGRFGVIFRLERSGSPVTNRNVRSSLHATTPETLATVEIPFMLGRSGKVQARSRWDRCPICGFYEIREKFVPDGYRSGLLVCSKCWDPEDPPAKPIPPDTPPIND